MRPLRWLDLLQFPMSDSWLLGTCQILCMRRLIRVPWTVRRSNQSILKEISPGCSLEGLMLKLKLQSFGHLMRRTDSLKRLWCWERLKVRGEGDDRGWVVGWHHWLNGHESEQTLGAGDGQGSLVCCSLWGCKELDTTEWLNWTEKFARWIWGVRILRGQRIIEAFKSIM